MDKLSPKQITTSRSFTYNYYFSPPSAGKETILFCHGWPDSAHLWSALSSATIGKGYGAVIPDLLGYGGTSKPTDPAVYNHKSQCEDLREILDHESVEKVIALGHDWGSTTANHFVLHHPDRSVGLIMFNVGYFPPAPFEMESFLATLKQNTGSELFSYWRLFAAPEGFKLLDEKIESLLTTMYAKDGHLMGQIWSVPDGLKNWLEADKRAETADYATPEFQKSFVERIRSQGGFQAPLCWYKAQAQNHHWNLGDKHLDPAKGDYVIKVPTLYVGSSKDDVCTAKLAPLAAPLIPDFTIAEEIDAGHWVPYERPKELEERVLAWLAKKF